MWIGAFKTEKESYFEWTINGLRVDFSDWAPGEPAVQFADNCVSIDQSKGFKWASFSCSSRFNWICEQRLEISDPNLIG
ncbi:low affinity immunoglobulin epsilon Fc receptor-like [Mya arenaria]|uniref:low affinity immunoglobulin epsilon Fc receptor-like n=1 Tax=Mya arenaria TaxID=6604 RepID=UPI0022E024BB|nr:low affinity immunoglobulin epsilon Fc receptor-like [Mya arenaria]